MWRAVVLLMFVSCRLLPPPPGDEQLGEYAFVGEPRHDLPDGGHGELLSDGGLACGVSELSLPTFRFDGTVTRDTATGQAWLTLGAGYPRDAGWNGQVLDSVAAERRIYPSCAACGSVVATERITFVLLSPAQVDGLGGNCTDDALAVPDGGAPMVTADGFNAALACGRLELSLSVSADAGADCPQECRECVVKAALRGERR